MGNYNGNFSRKSQRCSGGNETSSRDQKDDFLSIACILLVAVILAAVIYFYVNHQYSSYEVKNTIALKKAVV